MKKNWLILVGLAAAGYWLWKSRATPARSAAGPQGGGGSGGSRAATPTTNPASSSNLLQSVLGALGKSFGGGGSAGGVGLSTSLPISSLFGGGKAKTPDATDQAANDAILGGSSGYSYDQHTGNWYDPKTNPEGDPNKEFLDPFGLVTVNPAAGGLSERAIGTDQNINLGPPIADTSQSIQQGLLDQLSQSQLTPIDWSGGGTAYDPATNLSYEDWLKINSNSNDYTDSYDYSGDSGDNAY